ncbi:MAG TPA: hypothetical protein VF294_04555 [Polyangiaceae bacterium]
MLRRNIAWSIVALGVASTMWACGSDGDDSIATTGGDGGASAGASGHAGHAAGSGGTTAQGGTSTGGTSTGGNATAGLADALGGEGGAIFGTGGLVDQGGAGGELAQGGEGGAPTPTPTLADNCATICGDQTGLSCNYGSACVQGCMGTADPDLGTAFPDEYIAMIACQAKQLTAIQYECSTQMNTQVQPAPKAGTACEALICKFTCDDAMYVDDNIVARCCQ